MPLIRSYSFHTEGKIYCGKTTGDNFYAQKISSQSTIGFGIDYSNQLIFITLNGKEIGLPIKSIEIAEYYPTISLSSPNERIILNCYHEPYQYNLSSYKSSQRALIASSILDTPIRAFDAHSLISDYFGYYGVILIRLFIILPSI
jgi:hypothetical protein